MKGVHLIEQKIILDKYNHLGVVNSIDEYEVEFYRENDDSYHSVSIISDELKHEIKELLTKRNYTKEHIDYYKSIYCTDIVLHNESFGNEEFYQWKETVYVDTVENKSFRYTKLTKKEISYLKKILKKL